jgi:ATP synthase F1 delta subunit
MSNFSRKIARQYANATYKTCNDSQILQNVIGDITKILSLLDEMPSVKKMLYIKWISQREKNEIWAIIADNCPILNPLVPAIIKIMISHNRLHLMEIVLKILQDLLYDDIGIVKISITTAYCITDEYKNAIISDMETLIKMKVEAEFMTNRRILDGIVVESKSKMLDLSLRKRLSILQNSMSPKIQLA